MFFYLLLTQSRACSAVRWRCMASYSVRGSCCARRCAAAPSPRTHSACWRRASSHDYTRPF
ncbi:hypothetical protein PR003_g13560 [Phytophthora rubi]|nr:hypothetical protein PR002_g12999 [Phytophthora rubi]KAE9023899.1 hypothetical protein PR001_g12804 [Phytophthora rubi]KAE9334361.1 hypothetical protein PR003_g13560 [Phytophthora rubi]